MALWRGGSSTGPADEGVGTTLGGLFFDALFGFEDEVVAAVEVDEIGGGGAVGCGDGDGAVEDVVVFGVVGGGGVGMGELEEVAEFGEEELVVGAFGAAGGVPAGEEDGEGEWGGGHGVRDFMAGEGKGVEAAKSRSAGLQIARATRALGQVS